MNDMPIKNLSGIRRLPRLGKIHLGTKKVSEKSGKEYPTETDYFVVPPEIAAIYGDKPKELPIMFPVESPEVFFPQYYKCYGTSLLTCKGDGERAWTWDEEKGGLKEINCPCEKLEAGNCKQVATLQFMIPNLGVGVWQITTSSRNSIIDLNSAISLLRGVCGHVGGIPLILKRAPIETQRIEGGKPKRTTHFTLQIEFGKTTLGELQRAAASPFERVALPPPDETKDDLLYPVNGFEKEADPEPDKGAEPVVSVLEKTVKDSPVDSLTDLKAELQDVVDRFQKAGNTIKNSAWKRISELKTAEEYKKAIDFYKAGIEG